MDEEQLITFHKLLNIQNTTSADEMRAAYKAGFKDGATTIIDVMD
jgi:hypothetical protein